MNQYLIIKCGGSVFDRLTPDFFKSIRAIQSEGEWKPVIVHGGGPAISRMLKKMQIPTAFHNGLRVTSKDVLSVAEMVLSGSMNKQLVADLSAAGAKAVGLSGIDGHTLMAKPCTDPELGYVGEVASADPELITCLCGQGYIPVISPISMDAAGQHYNINADHAAAAIASSLNGKLCFISDVPGILVEQNGKLKKLAKVSDLEIASLIENKEINGGMVPKVKAAVDSLRQHVREVVIVNGMMPECLIDYTRGAEVGTRIFLEGEALHA
ncbi:acetylglutamate kinase [Sporolactobacillus vineae]|uniref:acetylglutamate kinase n=1 Tax=Sporolactobacillus vineae TaxID=444463 RepID=UPI00028A4173|nr:acetylglutamate kinase [Sporolactobacillus vineae]